MRIVELDEKHFKEDAFQIRKAWNRKLKSAIKNGEDISWANKVVNQIIHDTNSHAQSEYEFWSDTHDGSSGAAWSMAIYKGCEKLSLNLDGITWKDATGNIFDGSKDYDEALSNLCEKDIEIEITGISDLDTYHPEKMFNY